MARIGLFGSGLRILFLGDSYTEGSGSASACNYPEVAAQELSERIGAPVEAINAGVGGDTTRRFKIEVDPALPDGTSEQDHLAAEEAATQLLALPWELLHHRGRFLLADTSIALTRCPEGAIAVRDGWISACFGRIASWCRRG